MRAVCVAIWCCLGAARAAPAEPCARDDGPSAVVLRVIDGETLVLDDGQEVRLIGALAPKPDAPSADASAWPPARDAAQALEALVADRTVTLRYDGRRSDRYGRALAQLYVAARDGDEQSGEIWIQERLIRDGHARAYALPGNGGCLSRLMAAEAEARSAQRGLWRRDPYRVRAAGDVDALARLTGQFALVEGRVADVARAQRTIYINFGRDWRRDFTASVASAIAERSDGGAERVSALAGKTVRVRGWIERRNGPMIVLTSLDEIEVLDEGTADADDGQAADAKTPR